MLFSLITKNYVPYITELNLVYKNAMNELLQGDSDDICSIILQRESNKSTEITSVLYDSQILGINIGEIQISMDPYKKQQFQILINCSSGNYDNKFNYRIDVTSFQCQLGEFYVDEGCQICDSKQGFYSVTYNTTKCSIFDTSKFENVTSNLIQLKVGYWRPQYDSDLVENCFKNQNWCLGGWSVNDDLCYPGHVGGLCEECDIQHKRLWKIFQGIQYQMSIMQYSIFLGFISLDFVMVQLFNKRSFTSVFITLKSLKNSNRLFLQLKLKTKFFLIVFKYSQGIMDLIQISKVYQLKCFQITYGYLQLFLRLILILMFLQTLLMQRVNLLTRWQSIQIAYQVKLQTFNLVILELQQ
ncbi:hypothetical protein FGO68_gene8504 [Halteria grandinella]|uniref:Transmembrane protein n=1 Tax=Halteria grandinella TaxID=5974 RepID=A0A8J8NFV2_HALGN|nr:hypothetical protein FGO68_gene8504 [Halteria grandinella]